MSGKRLKKIRMPEKRRKELHASAERGKQDKWKRFMECRERDTVAEFKSARSRYLKIWLSGYFLYMALFALIFFTAISIKTRFGFLVAIIDVMIYFMFLKMHHNDRISKYDTDVNAGKYEFAVLNMGLKSAFGMAYACISVWTMFSIGR